MCGKPEHAEHAVWKCRYCCDLAVWFCFGTTHFCDSCHNGWIAGKISAKTTPASVDTKCSGGHGCKLKRVCGCHRGCGGGGGGDLRVSTALLTLLALPLPHSLFPG